MSRAVKGSIVVLIILLVVSIAAAVMTLLQNEDLKSQVQSLQSQVADYEIQEKKLIKQTKDLKSDASALEDKLKLSERKKNDIQKRADELVNKMNKVQSDLSKAEKESSDWKERVSTMRRERDDLMKKLQERPEKVVEKVVYKESSTTENASASTSTAQAPQMNSDDLSNFVQKATKDAASEEYWAGVMREKAKIEVELKKLKTEMDDVQLEMVDMKNRNNDLQLEITRLRNDRDSIVREIKQGEDLANNLSLQLARARNEQRYTEELADKIKGQNAKFSTQVKELTNTKLALEKTIARLNSEKNGVEQKLLETEHVIQGRIDEIWQIKETLDRRIGTLPVRVNQREIELPPIIVNATNKAQEDISMMKTPLMVTPANVVGSTVISVNPDNNFVIVDRGVRSGAKVGDALTVYRGPSQIATLEVIQVREDISAADIRTKTAQIKVGDTVR